MNFRGVGFHGVVFVALCPLMVIQSARAQVDKSVIDNYSNSIQQLQAKIQSYNCTCPDCGPEGPAIIATCEAFRASDMKQLAALRSNYATYLNQAGTPSIGPNTPQNSGVRAPVNQDGMAVFQTAPSGAVETALDPLGLFVGMGNSFVRQLAGLALNDPTALAEFLIIGAVAVATDGHDVNSGDGLLENMANGINIAKDVTDLSDQAKELMNGAAVFREYPSPYQPPPLPAWQPLQPLPGLAAASSPDSSGVATFTSPSQPTHSTLKDMTDMLPAQHSGSEGTAVFSLTVPASGSDSGPQMPAYANPTDTQASYYSPRSFLAPQSSPSTERSPGSKWGALLQGLQIGLSLYNGIQATRPGPRVVPGVATPAMCFNPSALATPHNVTQNGFNVVGPNAPSSSYNRLLVPCNQVKK